MIRWVEFKRLQIRALFAVLGAGSLPELLDVAWALVGAIQGPGERCNTR